jgi:hypothetical protein
MDLKLKDLESNQENMENKTDDSNKNDKKDNTCQGLTLRKKKCLKKSIKGEKYCKIHKDKFKLEKPEDCIVCMENLKYNSLPLSCSHWVCRKCIIKWGKDICPVCRSKIKLSSRERKSMKLKLKKTHNNTERNIQNNIIDHHYISNILQELYYMNNDENEDEIYSFEEFYSILQRINEINVFIDDISDSDLDSD